MDFPIIGVLGGMGPYAGLDLVSRIFDETRAASDREHLPVALLSYGHRITDRSGFVFGQTDINPGYAIAELALELERLGAAVGGIACNSAHAPVIFDLVQQKLRGRSIRILHLIGETVRFISETRPDACRIGCLSTYSVHQHGLYQHAVEAAGLEAILPADSVAEEVVHRAIYDPIFGIKAISNPCTEKAISLVRQAITHVQNRGADAVILGCTELPLAVPPATCTVCIDPARALARALIRETSPQKLKPLGGM
ncbi:MAG: amino acid racemase [Bacteroidota bacterium]|nr:amino acid racemase [Bacteroidota bacterium]